MPSVRLLSSVDSIVLSVNLAGWSRWRSQSVHRLVATRVGGGCPQIRSLDIASHSLKFCTQNLFPEGSSMIVESAAAKPTSAAARHSVSGATNVKAEARLPSDL